MARKKQQSSSVSLSGEKFAPPMEIEDVIRDTLSRFFKEPKRKDSKEEEVEYLSAILEEYLQSCIVVGYGMDGAPVVIMNAPDQQSADSLGYAMGRFMMSRNI